MRRSISLLILAVVALCLQSAPLARAGTCSGGANCRACTNCRYCGHCAKGGGTCSVCSPSSYGVLAQLAPPAATPVPVVVAALQPTAPPTPALPVAVRSGASAVQSQETLAVCVQAIAAQSDPAKLATLGTRAANPRLKRIMYYLAQARAGGVDAGQVIDQAQRMNGSAGTPRAPLVKASLLRNLKICDGLGMLTLENMAGLRQGHMPIVTRGPYVGQGAEVDHIVPRAISPETDNELANLELLPAGLNRSKSAKVGERQMVLARKFQEAGLISEATMARVQRAFRPAGTLKYDVQEP